MNNGGPAAVAPHGGTTPIFGTNPIAIGIPSKKGPIVLDMSTSEQTWGEINLAKVEKRQLKENIFLDKKGAFTTNPHHAEAIIPFGQAKGYGLNFMIEILTGALVGAKMGLQTKNGCDLGFFFLAFSPEMFTTKKEFEKKVSQLLKEIKSSQKIPEVKEIYFPGERSDKIMQANLSKGYVDIDETVWKKLEAFAKGGDVKKMSHLKE
jgi:LDH2 family malate/lactate/ureidoglycolate dehydrogenase